MTGKTVDGEKSAQCGAQSSALQLNGIAPSED